MDLSPFFLSRLQFALTIGFHFIFPPLSIGLAWLVVIAEWKGWKGADPVWAGIGRFLGKLLALTFALGVATGIVMEFQFGMNWARYSVFVGDIFGAPLAAEALFAFFLESTFLGLFLFGRERLSKGVHWFSILMVAVGSMLSAFWIIVANSWQQTPAGYVINEQLGRAELTSFSEAVFNPSTLHRFFHVFVGSLIAGALLAAGAAAVILLKKRDHEPSRRLLRLGLIFGLVCSVLMLYPSGHHSAEQVARTQPEKFVTFEGLVDGRENAPFTIFGVPRTDPLRLDYAVGIPGLLSWFATGDTQAYVPGIRDLQAEGWPTPPFQLVFISFHLMVLLGLFFIALTGWGSLFERGRAGPRRWFLHLLPWSIPLPLIALQLGWIVAEVGRQPWVVYRLLKTGEAFSENVSRGELIGSILMFSVVYLLLGILFVQHLVKLIRQGPDALPAKEA